ncbi:D-amino acid oxidase, partial [mine drainage metagenome]
MRDDLIVIGGGIVGAAIALAASEAGCAVTLIESGLPATGATGAGMGHLVALDDALLALSARSLELWRALPNREQMEYRNTGTIWIAETEDDLPGLREQAIHLATHQVTSHLLDHREMHALEPDLADDLPGGLLVPSDATVFAPKAVAYLLNRAQQAGTRILLGRKAETLTGGGVRLSGGERLKGVVVVATGPSGSGLLPELPITPRKGHLVVTERAPSTTTHQLVEAGYLYGVHATEVAMVAMNVQPRPGGQLLVGSSREPGIHDRAVSSAIVSRMLMRVFRFLPTLRERQAIRIWTGFRPATPDGLPFIRPGSGAARC